MNILTVEQLYEADKFTIQKQKITSDELMERAATCCFNSFHLSHKELKPKIHIFCGTGNNGGDGLVLCRLLKAQGYDVAAYEVNFSQQRSKDFQINRDRLKSLNYEPTIISNEKDFPKIEANDLIVDALFGIGLNRKPDTWVAALIEYLNQTQAFIYSIDIPSGMYMYAVPENQEAVIKADHVWTFQLPKLVFFLPQTGQYIKNWEVLDIGLDMDFIKNTKSNIHLVIEDTAHSLYRPREKFTHKGTYGHSFIVGGSYGKIGAVVLSSKSCLKVGAGLVTTYVPECGYDIMQTAVPEVMVLTDERKDVLSEIIYDFTPTVVGIGMGIGTSNETKEAFLKFLEGNKAPLVIDADGLNILSKQKKGLQLLPPKSILTPHPKELERLIGTWENDFDKLEKAKAFAQKHAVILVLKGAHTITINEDHLYINTTGNPGMATAGSGDVLAGMITGLVSQGHDPLKAAIFGVYLHGKAGDCAAAQHGEEALTATALIDAIGEAYRTIISKDKITINHS
ncbi:NAD(P)H-hydrate dehydratase [Leptobacterium sp. I13]|uniref:NAD(P)H-hydrate dehydratase n=1 Tax=Leptobacterium meishanense TaxID=3128904 RepID=UPI0030EEC7FB